ncbi:MAG: hypothetical protein ACRDHL_12860, partial [Candidatus Promineifilaceae bacterium]
MSKSAGAEDLNELRNRLDWFDEERRKSARRMTELEQRLGALEREQEGREIRIKEMEEKAAKAAGQLARLGQVDGQFRQLRDELVKMLDQNEQRRVGGQEELEKLRRLESDHFQRELSDLRKELAPIGHLQHDMELRQSEEGRLSGLITGLQTRLAAVENETESWSGQFKYVEDMARANARTFGELQTMLTETAKRFDPLETRVEVASHNAVKAQAMIQEYQDALSDMRHKMKASLDNIQVGEYERSQKMEQWRREAEERGQQMERYRAERLKYVEQYREAKRALESVASWQAQMEQRQKETDELARVELNRMRSEWDNFSLESDKRWRSAAIDQEQRWSGLRS